MHGDFETFGERKGLQVTVILVSTSMKFLEVSLHGKREEFPRASGGWRSATIQVFTWSVKYKDLSMKIMEIILKKLLIIYFEKSETCGSTRRVTIYCFNII